MGFTIAVSGKGGTGKTTFAGFVIRYLLEVKKGPVLAVDADANTNLNEVLGLEVKCTIGETRELMKEEVPAGMTKDVWFEYKVQQSLTEAKGFDLLAMGRPEGPGCYCAANTLARKYMDILTGNYAYVVIDNEAGMEHFSRLTTRDVDLLFILSDPSRRGIRTADRIHRLIGELRLNIERTVLVVNRVKGDLSEDTKKEIEKTALELAGTIPEDDEVNRRDWSDATTFHLSARLPAVQAAWRICDQYIA